MDRNVTRKIILAIAQDLLDIRRQELPNLKMRMIACLCASECA